MNIPRRRLACLLLALVVGSAAAASDQRPNILWITSEDNAADWLGCYGNDQAETPRIDQLAAEGYLFLNAFSNAPVCAVARSTLLNGAYAPTLGTQHMRSRYVVPERYRPYVAYLREHGYYCTNNSKTDYNQQGDDRAFWDESSRNAHYRNRPEGSPFFAIFNLTVSHESSLFPDRVAQRRQEKVIPQPARRDPADIDVPAHLPDLPEIRRDLAIYYDTLTAMDQRVGELLDELEAEGLADETIVFYYADHGGPTPRGKRYLKDTGVKVPMIVRLPARWSDWASWASDGKVEELVAFVDLAPTALSLAGIETPPQMQGRAFLGPQRQEPAPDSTVFLYGDRFDELVGMRRGLTDGRYKYIRRFSPYLPAAPYSFYQFSMPGWVAWRDAAQRGELDDSFRSIWRTPQPVEELYDTQNDPSEIRNLADDPGSSMRLTAMREKLREVMIDVRDTGVIPEALFPTLAEKQPIADYAQDHPERMQHAVELAFFATAAEPDDLPALLSALDADDAVVRYWGAIGCLILGEDASSAAGRLKQALDDPAPTVRIAVAWALYGTGDKGAGRAALFGELDRDLRGEERLYLLNALRAIEAGEDIPDEWLQNAVADPDANAYVKRLATRLLESRE